MTSRRNFIGKLTGAMVAASLLRTLSESDDDRFARQLKAGRVANGRFHLTKKHVVPNSIEVCGCYFTRSPEGWMEWDWDGENVHHCTFDGQCREETSWFVKLDDDTIVIPCGNHRGMALS